MNNLPLLSRVHIHTTCHNCCVTTTVEVIYRDLILWRNGELPIQLCFPYLTPALRELLKSRICGECFDAMLKPRPEETRSRWSRLFRR